MSHEKRGRETSAGDTHGSGGATLGEGEPETDPTLQHPRCVFQVLKRHYARYTPEMVERVCGIPPETFLRVAEEITRNSGRERTTAFAYAVGWTHQTKGVQIIRAASILQLLLGNMGRPGGGIMALRGHASIQGSTDISTLFNTLPGYIPAPEATAHPTLEEFVADNSAATGFWGNMRAYTVSLLKAWWGDAATAENDYCFDYIPKVTGDHGNYQSVMDMIDGKVRGYFLWGENPAVGSANGRMQRKGLANLEWLVVRDNVMIDSASFWKDGPEVARGRVEDRGHRAPRSSSCRPRRTWRRTARSPTPSGCCSGTRKPLNRRVIAAAICISPTTSDGCCASASPASADERDRPLLDLTWDYPTEGEFDEPSAEAVLAEVNGYRGGRPAAAVGLHRAEGRRHDGRAAAGSTAARTPTASTRPRAASPAREQNAVAPEWAWAWPNNRRLLYNRASADPAGQALERAQEVRLVGRRGRQVDRRRRAGLRADQARRTTCRRRTRGRRTRSPAPTRSSCRPTAAGGSTRRAGWSTGRCRRTTSRRNRRSTTRCTTVQANPTRELHVRAENPFNPSGSEPGSEVYPFVHHDLPADRASHRRRDEPHACRSCPN